MEILLYVVLWLVVSIIVWMAIFEMEPTESNGGNRKESTITFQIIKVFGLAILTFPVTFIFIWFISIHLVFDYINKRRTIFRLNEEAKYGIFERKVLIEKCCNHIWEETEKKFRPRYKYHCPKCKKKTNIRDEFMLEEMSRYNYYYDF